MNTNLFIKVENRILQKRRKAADELQDSYIVKAGIDLDKMLEIQQQKRKRLNKIADKWAIAKAISRFANDNA